MGQRADTLFSHLMAAHARGVRASSGRGTGHVARAADGATGRPPCPSRRCPLTPTCSPAPSRRLRKTPRAKGTLAAHLGLAPDAFGTVIGRYFAPQMLARLDVPVGRPQVDEEAQMLENLLRSFAAPGDEAAGWLAAIIACRALRANHLWQGPGTARARRTEPAAGRAFPRLAAGNTANMKWKKYFYRQLCAQEGFVLCTAPSCAACADFEACFGERAARAARAGAPRERDGAPDRLTRSGPQKTALTVREVSGA